MDSGKRAWATRFGGSFKPSFSSVPSSQLFMHIKNRILFSLAFQMILESPKAWTLQKFYVITNLFKFNWIRFVPLS